MFLLKFIVSWFVWNVLFDITYPFCSSQFEKLISGMLPFYCLKILSIGFVNIIITAFYNKMHIALGKL